MQFAYQLIGTTHDAGGNPRRSWMIYELSDPQWVRTAGIVDEGPHGYALLDEWCAAHDVFRRAIPELPSMTGLSPSAYREFRTSAMRKSVIWETGADSKPTVYYCQDCGEEFIGPDRNEQHQTKSDGTPCGGLGMTPAEKVAEHTGRTITVEEIVDHGVGGGLRQSHLGDPTS